MWPALPDRLHAAALPAASGRVGKVRVGPGNSLARQPTLALLRRRQLCVPVLGARKTESAPERWVLHTHLAPLRQFCATLTRQCCSCSRRSASER